ncbi:Protein TPR1 [Camellia lanceoleosa]|uniref:Protein TPR1 n=1 Tax=Camellia lanceoleosa TaxID=1840588 RepID=A0ACC0IKJ5_9ERIC|nr:Protein TPR1 [Camellia lanceoleosa]
MGDNVPPSLTSFEATSFPWENKQISKYGDTKTARSIMLIELKKLIEANPLFRGKLVFPTLKSSRLRTLINQRPNPDIKTLFTDHTCTPPNGALAPSPISLPLVGVAKPTAYPSLGAYGPFPLAAATANANALAGWMANVAASSSIQAAVVATSSLPLSTKSRCYAGGLFVVYFALLQQVAASKIFT